MNDRVRDGIWGSLSRLVDSAAFAARLASARSSGEGSRVFYTIQSASNDFNAGMGQAAAAR